MTDGIVRGYKATDAKMRCQGYQFVLGQWHKHEGPIQLCHSGFHFCMYPSGPLIYCPVSDARLFEVEAWGTLHSEPISGGTKRKHVCSEIRLVREITTTCHTKGNNIGYCNTGQYNTGDRNVGSFNAGSNNVVMANTGDYNTGRYNSGMGNATGYSSGFFCRASQHVLSFDEPTGLTREEYLREYSEVLALVRVLVQGDFQSLTHPSFCTIPGFTLPKAHALMGAIKNQRAIININRENNGR